MKSSTLVPIVFDAIQVVLDLVVKLTKTTGMTPEELRARFKTVAAEFAELDPKNLPDVGDGSRE